MKSLLLIVLVFFTLNSCSKSKEKVTVIKNCTGVYLNQNDKNYLVCNRDLLKDIESGQIISAKFKDIDTCDNEWIVCHMVFPSHGMVKVLKVL